MASPIKLTENIKNDILNKIIEDFNKNRIFNGEVFYKQSYEYKDIEKARIIFEPLAWIKMCALVDNASSEIAWNGTVKRDEENRNIFYITDIMIYPQTVSSVTVTVDEAEYAEWQDKTFENDEDFMSCRFQGHSHVNMSPTPSSTDIDTRKTILKTIANEDYYIFMIINKSKEYTAAIYDMEQNTYYESKDIIVSIDGFNYKDFVTESKKMVKTKSFTSSSANSTTSSAYTYKNVTPIGSTNSTSKDEYNYKPYIYGYNCGTSYSSYGHSMDDDDIVIDFDESEMEDIYGKDWWKHFGYKSLEEYKKDNEI